MRKRGMGITGLVILALLAGVTLAAEKNDGSTLTKLGDPVPKFELTTLDGKRIESDAIKGKVVFLNFFATWCGPCRTELPHLEKEIWNRFKDEENFVMIVAGREHTREELLTFRAETKYTMPFAPDPGRKVYSLFAKQWIPRNYVIDSGGRIIFQSQGYEPQEFEKILDLLQENLDALEETRTKKKPTVSR